MARTLSISLVVASLACFAFLSGCSDGSGTMGGLDVSGEFPEAGEVATDDVPANEVCTPKCAGKECGDDGCGGECGKCPAWAPFCSDSACIATCTPECDGKQCGPDQCGGFCGECDAGDMCIAGECKCTPDCTGKECGDDGCGGTCGECDEGYVCSDEFKCVEETCNSDCEGKECGDDGCGGSCGPCPEGIGCVDFACSCLQQCEGKECGDDGCGGDCGPCSDGIPCTIDTCIADSCDSVPDDGFCDDNVECTADSCDVATGCVSTPLTGAPCDDGEICTVDDQCVAGICMPGTLSTDPICQDICDDDAQCPPDDNLCDGLLVYNPVSCLCEVDPGSVVACGQTDPCSFSQCAPATGLCSVSPLPAGTTCDDGDLCTVDDKCTENGTCAGGASVTCDDGNQCNGEEACDPQTGGCITLPGVVCDDGNPCTTDTCDPVIGCASAPNDAGVCDDGNACNGAEKCSGGTCVPGVPPNLSDGIWCTDDACGPNGVTHTPNTPMCNDGNACTVDVCDLKKGCQYTSLDEGCSDGNACNGVEKCVAGGCAPGAPLACDDGKVCTDDSCAPATGCVFTADNNNSCSDNNKCNGQEICFSGDCLPGASLNCNDGNECTTDTCDAATGCTNPAVQNGTPCKGGGANSCKNGVCTCTPTCAGKKCGSDGCGGTCGTCPQGENCIAFQCTNLYTCVDMLTCGTGCNFTPTCLLNCYGQGAPSSKALFEAYGWCVIAQCGINITPTCVMTATAGSCSDEFAACAAD